MVQSICTSDNTGPNTVPLHSGGCIGTIDNTISKKITGFEEIYGDNFTIQLEELFYLMEYLKENDEDLVKYIDKAIKSRKIKEKLREDKS